MHNRRRSSGVDRRITAPTVPDRPDPRALAARSLWGRSDPDPVPDRVRLRPPQRRVVEAGPPPPARNGDHTISV